MTNSNELVSINVLILWSMQISVDLSPVMVYWFDDVARYSKGFQGAISTFSWAIALILIVINGTVLKGLRYRTLFTMFQLLQALISCLDLLLVCVAKDAFWGHFIALSDKAGTQGITLIKIIIVNAVVSDHVPDNGEASASAFLMLMTNLPEFLVAPLVGAWVVDGLGIRKGSYANLPYAILIRTIVRLLPTIFIPFLVPTGGSKDKTSFDTNDLDNSSSEMYGDKLESLTDSE